MEKFGEVGIGKSGVRENKSGNISETRKDRGKVTIWRAYRKSPTLFRMVPPRPPVAFSSSKLGVLLSQEQLPYTDFEFGGYIYMANPNTNPLKIGEKRERWRIQGLPNFFGTPYYLRNG